MTTPTYKLVTGNTKKCEYSFLIYKNGNVSIAISVNKKLIAKRNEDILKKHLAAFCEEINQ
jgi:hypothetical protein